MFPRPILNRLEITTGMCRFQIAKHFLLGRAPLPENRRRVAVALDALAQLIVTVLHVINIILRFVRARHQIELERFRIDQFAERVETVQLVENVQLDHVLRAIARERRRRVGQTRSLCGRDLGHADLVVQGFPAVIDGGRRALIRRFVAVETAGEDLSAVFDSLVGWCWSED